MIKKTIYFYKRNIDLANYSIIFLLTFFRVILSRVRSCPEFFDCNSYINMVQTIAYNPDIAPHHQMRILPSIMVKGLTYLNFSIIGAFQFISGLSYILFGLGLYFVINKFSKNRVLAFGFTLIILSAHHAIKIPLTLVFQATDALTYPVALAIIYFTLQKRKNFVLVLSILGILVRQNIFVLSVLSFIYLIRENKNPLSIIFLSIIILEYFALNNYYHAISIFQDLLDPPDGFFTVSNFIFIIKDSKILELFIPVYPFLFVYFKPILALGLRYWFIFIYALIVMGQPFLAYDLTGNNFARIALQGAWIFYLLIPWVMCNKQLVKSFSFLLILYSIILYITWGFEQRMLILLMFVFSWICINNIKVIKRILPV